MKRAFGVFAVIAIVMWAGFHFTRKKNDPSVEEVAEKLGRAARQRMEHKGQPQQRGLQINETSTDATTTASSTSTDAASLLAGMQSQALPEDNAKARVMAMLSAMQSGSKLKAAAIWAHGLQPNAMDDIQSSMERFDAFLREKAVTEKFSSFEVVNTIRRVNGPESYTAVDVTLDGVLYHLGVPDSASPISWSF